MKLMTKEIEKAARKNYEMGSDMEQMVVAKFFFPDGGWTWYLMNQKPDEPNYLWGIVDGFEVEMGSFGLDELENTKSPRGLSMERDMYFEPRKAIDLWNRLKKGEKI